jgi:multimeric flavodoxin WrbA
MNTIVFAEEPERATKGVLEMTRKVLVVNGSPRMERGNTSRFVALFIEGMEKAGASVEVIYSKQLEIKSCIGGLRCWFDSIGECIYDDDMTAVLAKMRKTDILVFATPVYIQLPGGGGGGVVGVNQATSPCC